MIEVKNAPNEAQLKKERSAQAVGKVRLNERKKYKVTRDTKHLVKGQEVLLNEPTAALFKAKGII